MKAKLLYALLSSSVVSASAFGLTTLATDHLSGDAGRVAQKYLVAPGEMALERLDDHTGVRKLRKKTRTSLKKGRKKLDKAADRWDDSLRDSSLGRRAKHYNIGIWTFLGFIISLILTLILGVSSVKTALVLGAKVTVAMLFLQISLVLAGILALQRFAGS